MGNHCSLDDEPESEKNSNRSSIVAGQREQVPRDVLLQRMWNSVVVGELVKGQHLMVMEETATVLQVVTTMIKTSSNYCLIKQKDEDDDHNIHYKKKDTINGNSNSQNLSTSSNTNTSGHSRTHTTLHARLRKKKEKYLGLFDWRDLNILLVLACKQHRLQAGGMVEEGAGAGLTSPTQGASIRLLKSASSTIDADSTVNTPTRSETTTPASPHRRVGETIPLTTVVRGVAASPSAATTTTIALTSPAAAKPKIVIQPTMNHSASTGRLTIKSNTNPYTGNSVASTTASIIEVTPALQPFIHFLDMKQAPIGLVANLCQRNIMKIINQVCPLLGGTQILVGASGASSSASTTDLLTSTHKSKIQPTASEQNRVLDLYRLTVVNKDGQFIGCMHQLAVCNFIKNKLSSLPSGIGDETLHELGLGQRRCMTISWKAQVLSAITIMSERQLSALAIINDSNGKLVGTISCSDVKYLFLAPDLLLTLQRPVSVFVSMLRQSTSYWHINIASNPPATAVSPSVTVTPKTTLSGAIHLLSERKVRRAWVVNDNEQPIGLLSITDILKLLLPNPNPNHNGQTKAAIKH